MAYAVKKGDTPPELKNLRITFVNLDSGSVKIVGQIFSGYNNVESVKADVSKLLKTRKFDCVVSPANSFGIMDGGIDAPLSQFFPQVMYNVWRYIDSNYHGEQPVGTCLLVPTGNDVLGRPGTLLAHSPTMRVPKDVKNTENAYYAFKAILCSVMNHNRNPKNRPIKNLLTTTFCTGSGDMPLIQSVNQMKLAYDHMNSAPPKHDWMNAHERDREIELSTL